MPLREPSWWYSSKTAGVLTPDRLRPVARFYGSLARYRYRHGEHFQAGLPVVCVGNFTAGGTGKTPLTALICERLTAMGERPAILTRGYGGRLSGPHWVTAMSDAPAATGDEPLLLARVAPTLIAKNRAAGARCIEGTGLYSAIVMDDGLLNSTLAKDISIAVLDGGRGVGNGEVIPSGPLRAPLDFQLGLVDGIVVNCGATGADARAGRLLDDLRNHFHGPVLEASVTANGGVDWLKGARVLAFAGIGNPDRFFDLATALGAELAERRVFPDHHPFSDGDAAVLVADAQRIGAALLTTEKDIVRLSGATGARATLRDLARTLPIRLSFEDRDLTRLDALLSTAIARRKSKG